MACQRDEDGDLRCTRTGKRVATIEELSASYGRRRILEDLAVERAQAARNDAPRPAGELPAAPRPHGKTGRHRVGGRAVIR